MRASARVILRVTKVSPRIGRFVVEQDAVAGVDAVGLAIIDGDPVGIELGHRVGAARIERRGFLLRSFLHQPVKLGSGGLIKACFLFQAENANGFEDAQGTEAIGIGGVFRRLQTKRRHGSARRGYRSRPAAPAG